MLSYHFQCLFHSNCGFDHVIHTFSDAKFHSEGNGIYCEAIRANILSYKLLYKDMCVFRYRKLVCWVGFAPMVLRQGKTLRTIFILISSATK